MHLLQELIKNLKRKRQYSQKSVKLIIVDNILSSGAPALNNGTGFNYGAQSGTFGYGAGGAGYYEPGIFNPKANSGQGGRYDSVGGSGFIRVTWFE